MGISPREAGRQLVFVSTRENQPPVCLPVSSEESIRIWAGWQSTAGENVRLEENGGEGFVCQARGSITQVLSGSPNTISRVPANPDRS